jgi:hypothetical protein
MSKQPIVFRPTGIEMVDHLISARPISPFKVMRLKTPQQQFSLIQPRSMCRCHKRPYLRVTGEKLPRLTRNVARPSIPDQVNASCFAVLSKQLRQLPAQVLTVVSLQTPPVHLPAVERHRHQEVDRNVAREIKLLMLNLANSHQLAGNAPLQNLHVGLLVQGQHHLVPFSQPVYPLINPENTGCSLPELFVQNGCLPVPESMRLQGCRTKKQRDRGMGNLRNDAPLDSHPGQRARRPVGHLQTYACRCTTCQLLNLDPLQGGKSPTGDQNVGHRRPRSLHASRNDDIDPRLRSVSVRLEQLRLQLWSLNQSLLKGFWRVAQCAALYGHCEADFPVHAGLRMASRPNVDDVSSCLGLPRDSFLRKYSPFWFLLTMLNYFSNSPLVFGLSIALRALAQKKYFPSGLILGDRSSTAEFIGAPRFFAFVHCPFRL